jgi:hypothetical protein
MGLVSGVMLMLAPAASRNLALAGMTSERGRSHTFDVRADGYARADACASLVMQPVPHTSNAAPITAPSAAPITAPILDGSAVQQDGKSASLTAPNGRAQQSLLVAALADAALRSGSPRLAEMHGTGTSLGDPIEVGSFSAAVLGPGREWMRVAASGVKATLGHAEPAAGIVGLLELVLALQEHASVPNAQLRILNPHVRHGLRGRMLAMPTQLGRAGDSHAALELAGQISSFGYSGTIAHAVLHQRTGSQPLSQQPLVYCRIAFPWRVVPERSMPSRAAAATGATRQDGAYYRMSWVRVATSDGSLVRESPSARLLVLGRMERAPSRARMLALLHGTRQWSGILFILALEHGAGSCACELPVVDAALALLQCQAMMQQHATPIFLCTSNTQPVSMSSVRAAHSGLWGLARTARKEHSGAAVCCLDVGGGAAQALRLPVWANVLALPRCDLSWLGSTESTELEATIHGTTIHGIAVHVPRLASIVTAGASAWQISFATLRDHLDAHMAEAAAKLDARKRLDSAFAQLEQLCLQYARHALQRVQGEAVPLWHHRCLLRALDTALRAAQDDCAAAHAAPLVTSETVLARQPLLWPEVQLAERCGSRLAEVLMGQLTSQEALFPEGSLGAVLSVYEDSVRGAFCNECLVSALETALSLQAAPRPFVVLEVGAGTGGTASSILAVLRGKCERYVFTDVSESFLRRARQRFEAESIVEYALLNIDMDPALQGFALGEHHVVIATNVLHATPFVGRTLRNCAKLLCPGGLLLVNEATHADMFAQITFGLTDGGSGKASSQTAASASASACKLRASACGKQSWSLN